MTQLFWLQSALVLKNEIDYNIKVAEQDIISMLFLTAKEQAAAELYLDDLRYQGFYRVKIVIRRLLKDINTDHSWPVD